MNNLPFGKKLAALRPPGFTIMELLIVVAIIAILAGLVMSTAGFIQNKAARSRTQSELAGLEAALESYKADMGEYPQTNNGNPNGTANPTTNAFLRMALAPNGVTNQFNSLNKIYFSFSKGMGPSSATDLNAVTNSVLDAFGNPYGYCAPGTNNPGGYDLWSTAGKPTNLDIRIKNW